MSVQCVYNYLPTSHGNLEEKNCTFVISVSLATAMEPSPLLVIHIKASFEQVCEDFMVMEESLFGCPNFTLPSTSQEIVGRQCKVMEIIVVLVSKVIVYNSKKVLVT